MLFIHIYKLYSFFPCKRVKWICVVKWLNKFRVIFVCILCFLLYLHGHQLKILWKERLNTGLKT